jgi:glucokinase
MRRREGLVSPLNIPGWRDFPLVARLQTDTGLPVTLDNDAKAFAMGEHLFGAGRGRPHMLGVVVSTGVGGGVIERGALLHGRTGNAGHVGHVVAEPEGPECACGGRGCVEAIASGPSIVRLARAALARGTPSSLADPPRAEPLTTRDVARAAAGGDPLSLDLFRRAGRALGVGFAGAAALADFDLVVVGGGVSAVGELLLGPIREAIGRHVGLDYIRGLTVTAAGNGADAGLVGAAALMLSQRPAR